MSAPPLCTPAPPSPRASLDLATVYPGPLAASHDLLAVDGRRYTFTGDVTGGLWTRSIGPGCTDVHVWAPDGGYYLGWVCPGELHWATPPERVMPRWWDPAIPWSATVPHYVQAHRTAAGNTFSDTVLTVTIRSVVEQGEPLIYVGGGEGEMQEHWWISRTLPVRGGGYGPVPLPDGGCAPGIRGFLLLAGGQVTGSAEFVEWMPRADVSAQRCSHDLPRGAAGGDHRIIVAADDAGGCARHRRRFACGRATGTSLRGRNWRSRSEASRACSRLAPMLWTSATRRGRRCGEAIAEVWRRGRVHPLRRRHRGGRSGLEPLAPALGEPTPTPDTCQCPVPDHAINCRALGEGSPAP